MWKIKVCCNDDKGLVFYTQREDRGRIGCKKYCLECYGSSCSSSSTNYSISVTLYLMAALFSTVRCGSPAEQHVTWRQLCLLLNETGYPISNLQGNLIISTLVVTLKSRYVLKTHISDLAYSLS